jgi:hypothetical protein
MEHWKLKGCPRCGGDVLVHGTSAEPVVAQECLQCGWESGIAEEELAAVSEQ